jgi:rhamnosyl/mannosyltransferase
MALAKPALRPALRALHVGKFYPPYKGGMETHLQALCEGLQPDVSVQVVVASEDHRSTEDLVHGIKVTRAGTLFSFSAAQVCPRMVSEIRRAQADVIHLHWPNPMAVVAYLASGHRGPLVITYHSDVIRQKMLARTFAPILHRALARSAAIIVTSPNYLVSSPVLSAYRDRCYVIPFGIPLEHLQRYDEVAAMRIRQRYGPHLILSVGRLVYYKGYEYLIRAMARVQGHLLIVGQGPLRHKLEQLARECGVAERVTFAGYLPDAELAQYYHAADVFVLASIARSEAFGLVQLEAMACGKPVINTRLDSGVPFVSLDGVTGLTVPPMDTGALAAAINQLLGDSALRATYGAAARRRVRAEFSMEVMTRRTLDLYAQVFGHQTNWANGPVMNGAEKSLVGAAVGVTAGASACSGHRE